MKRHQVTRKTKSGKTVTYWRGEGNGSGKDSVGAGSELKKKKVSLSAADSAAKRNPRGKDEFDEEAATLRKKLGVPEPKKGPIESKRKFIPSDDPRSAAYQAASRKKGSC